MNKKYLIVTVTMNKKYLIVTVTMNKKYLIVTVTMNKKYLIVSLLIKYIILSQPNNNNLNNKTTKTIVGLRLSNCLEPPNHNTKSKLHERTRIEQYYENFSC